MRKRTLVINLTPNGTAQKISEQLGLVGGSFGSRSGSFRDQSFGGSSGFRAGVVGVMH